jgi:imidazole glycerol-phosphate synthase subunit HisH
MSEPLTDAPAWQTPPRIAVVDYGMGNRRSVEKALAHVGADALITSDHDELRAAAGLLLPGVGAFPAAMEAIRERGLAELLRERAGAGVPLLGSCLGMQLLFERSEEHEGAEGLGLLAGTVSALSAPSLKLPHIGWSAVGWRDGVGRGEASGPGGGPLRAGLPDPSFLYHVHSFVVRPLEDSVILATAEYGETFAAVVGRGNVFGTQSHPEKSSTHGLRLLANFASLCAGASSGSSLSPAPA